MPNYHELVVQANSHSLRLLRYIYHAGLHPVALNFWIPGERSWLSARVSQADTIVIRRAVAPDNMSDAVLVQCDLRFGCLPICLVDSHRGAPISVLSVGIPATILVENG